MADASATAVVAPAPPTAVKGLNVIALVSGGKDSFYSALHCLAHGHRLVALANLYPARASSAPTDGHPAKTAAESSGTTTVILPTGAIAASGQGAGSLAVGSTAGQAVDGQGTATELPSQQQQGDEDEAGLNSFMYQTVGHQVLPLYAGATGLPLYRHPIVGGALQSAREYADPSTLRDPPASASQARQDPGSSSSATVGAVTEASRGDDQRAAANQNDATAQQKGTPASADQDPADETESMVPLLQAIMKAHPEANALCSGAILSTYQRTRVESVATRLGLVPLAFLWKFPVLPGPGSGPADEAQLLRDMEAAGMQARVVRVASGGLDEKFLWEDVTSARGVERVRKAVSRYGAPERGAVIGEGGEFETLVLDGPRCLFKQGRIAVRHEERQVVSEGGGTFWLKIRGASVEPKPDADAASTSKEAAERLVRVPDLFDSRFDAVTTQLSANESYHQEVVEYDEQYMSSSDDLFMNDNIDISTILTPSCFVADQGSRSSIEEETRSIVTQIRSFLQEHSLQPLSITNTIVILRDMANFPTINAVYGSLFADPNPPSRVTISCGAQLPPGVGIAVFLSVHKALRQGDRQGLHVQSRSYWAPANIGPYSQAVTMPVASLLRPSKASREERSAGDGGARLVAIAGQIPLVPATMDLPTPEQDSYPFQLVLALQHLWRVGTELGVQWWSSAVAYVPRTPASDVPLSERAVLAGRAWRAAHLWSKEDQEEDDEAGPDLWDRKFDTRYRSFAAESEAEEHSLPDYGVLAAHPALGSNHKPVPPVFVAEVEQLPRSAQVEWHAHVGFAGAAAGSVRTATFPVTKGAAKGGVTHTVVAANGGEGAFVQTVVWWAYPGEGQEPLSGGDLDVADEDELRSGHDGTLGGKGAWLAPSLVPELVYIDESAFRAREAWTGWVPGQPRTPSVLCSSLWGGDGARLAAVLVYRGVLGRWDHK